MSGAETARRRVVQHRNSGAEMALPLFSIGSLVYFIIKQKIANKQSRYFYQYSLTKLNGSKLNLEGFKGNLDLIL